MSKVRPAPRGCIIAMPRRTTAEEVFAKAKADATQATLAFTVGLAHAMPRVARNSVTQAVVAETPAVGSAGSNGVAARARSRAGAAL